MNQPALVVSTLPEPAMALGCVQAGFSSPAEDFGIPRFDLAKSLIQHPATAFVMP
ncbi:S24/S26 family peptidase [Comamonas testosteroni]|nr:hypothetical protein [Comamonas testosteroni]EHN63894.1 hypothetical protein CTATCC11996_20249 [Comamonas testosteroni ATCC 11996]